MRQRLCDRGETAAMCNVCRVLGKADLLLAPCANCGSLTVSVGEQSSSVFSPLHSIYWLPVKVQSGPMV